MPKKKPVFSSHAVFQKKKTRMDRFADMLTTYFGTAHFLVLNGLIFFIWVVLNTELIPGVSAFDPFPYGFLTMAVSLEAIFLSIIVLMSQNRANKISELREELELEVDIGAEKEINKVLNMLDEIHNHLGLKPDKDAEFIQMKKKMDVGRMQQELAAKNGD